MRKERENRSEDDKYLKQKGRQRDYCHRLLRLTYFCLALSLASFMLLRYFPHLKLTPMENLLLIVAMFLPITLAVIDWVRLAILGQIR